MMLFIHSDQEATDDRPSNLPARPAKDRMKRNKKEKVRCLLLPVTGPTVFQTGTLQKPRGPSSSMICWYS